MIQDCVDERRSWRNGVWIVAVECKWYHEDRLEIEFDGMSMDHHEGALPLRCVFGNVVVRSTAIAVENFGNVAASNAGYDGFGAELTVLCTFFVGAAAL